MTQTWYPKHVATTRIGVGYYQPLNDPIAVVGIFAEHKLIPKKFLWREKTYPIDELTLVSDHKDGGVLKRLYSITSSGVVYRLEYNRTSEEWRLLEVWIEE